MKKLLIVVDVQNDFVNGTLGTNEAVAIIPNIVKKSTGGMEILYVQKTLIITTTWKPKRVSIFL